MRHGREWETGYIFILPTFLLLFMLFIFPLVSTFILSLFETNLATKWNFVFFKNYASLFRDRDFWESLRVTFFFAFGVVIGHFLLGTGFALLLNSRIPGRLFFRLFLLVPWIIPEIVAALTWSWMYNTTYGVINGLLLRIRVISAPVSWIGDPSLALPSLMLVVIWKGYPFVMMTMLAGLQAIPVELYEAAEIDGASGWDKFLYITLPGLRKVALITAILDSMWWFKHFTIIYSMTGGGPVRATEVLSISVYRSAFQNLEFGYASALAVFIFLVCVGIATAYQRVLGRGDET